MTNRLQVKKLISYECRSYSLVGSHEWVRLNETVAKFVLKGRSIENDARYQGDLIVQQKRWDRTVVYDFILIIIAINLWKFLFCDSNLMWAI
jgi:hypothetical protein